MRARNGVGAVTARQGDYKGALEHLNAALATAREKLAPNHPEVARSYKELGRAYVDTGRPTEGLELLRRALEMRRAAGAEPQEAADILRGMSQAHTNQGDDERALAVLEEAEAIQRATLGARDPRLADTLIAQGVAQWGQGRYDQSIAVFEEAVAILEATGGAGKARLAGAYLNIGTAYWSKSDYDQALAFYEKALPLQQAALGEAHPQVGVSHFNLAVLHLMKRQYDVCIASVERALAIFLPVFGERHFQVVQAYNVQGSALTEMGQTDRAVAVLERARTIQLSLPEAGDRDSALIYSSLADAYKAKGDVTRAFVNYRKALAVDLQLHGERHPDVAEDFVHLGHLFLEHDDEERALRYFARAITANDPRGAGADPDLDPPLDSAFSEEWLLKALQGAARARARRGGERKDRQELERAALVYEHVARLVDRMRAGYRTEGSKLSISAGATQTYDEAIRNELELHRLMGDERHLERAFRYAERAKAGVLRDALNEAEARSFAGIPASLLEQERKLRVDLASLDRRLTEARLEQDADAGRLRSLQDEQFARTREYDALQRRFEREYPDYYDLKYRFEPVGSAEVRERALDEATALVEYFLGRERVFIFTITRQSLDVVSVPREASLEADLTELRRASVDLDLPARASSAHRLFRQLLAPVESHLAGRNLVIIPEAGLSGVPFEALLKREASPDAASRAHPYVLRDHAVSYAYSATVLLQGLRRERERPPDEFVAFAPLFADGAATRDAPRPLPASRREVTDARELFARRQGLFGGWLTRRSRVYLGRDASEARLKSAGLERYRYVHLATHGIVDEQHPGLSRLLLAPDSASGEDGVLHLGEIYNLRLNADLVVLSACDTGRGRLARGEGIIGLTRSFLYAGAQSLLVSLWPVSDTAASELVVDFYRELLAGKPKAQALREAKLRAMARNPEYAKPYYWSSLVLVGQGR